MPKSTTKIAQKNTDEDKTCSFEDLKPGDRFSYQGRQYEWESKPKKEESRTVLWVFSAGMKTIPIKKEDGAHALAAPSPPTQNERNHDETNNRDHKSSLD